MIALVLIPGLLLGFLLGIVFVFGSSSQAACLPSGPAVAVDPGQVPEGPIAGYGHDQLVNAAQVMLAAQKLGLSARDQQIGVMTAMGESGLRVLTYGDAAGPDSRGLFQQRDNGAWGSLSDRLDPFISATNFFRVESTVGGRDSMDPSLVAHTVQRNSDPYYYTPFWAPAGQVVQALVGVVAGSAGASGSSSAGAGAGSPQLPSPQSPYDLGPVQPHTAVVANTVGPMFGIRTVGGYRPAGSEQYDPNGHPAGLALDFMINDIPDGVATGTRLAAYLQANASTLGVDYIIWQQHIWSVQRADEGWRAMPDRGSPTANHMDHVHLSLNAATPGSGDGAGASPTSGSASCQSGQSIGTVTSTGWAAPAKGPITSPFGPRTPPPGTNASPFHTGIDLAGGGCYAPIWAANKGQVVRAGPAAGYGNLIEIDNGGGIHTRYAHMFNDGLLVHVGDQVAAGQQIARIGTVGNSTGCHLHFEVLINGQAVDPAGFLAKVGVTITD